MVEAQWKENGEHTIVQGCNKGKLNTFPVLTTDLHLLKQCVSTRHEQSSHLVYRIGLCKILNMPIPVCILSSPNTSGYILSPATDPCHKEDYFFMLECLWFMYITVMKLT